MRAMMKIEYSRAFGNKWFALSLLLGIALAIWQLFESAVSASQYLFAVSHEWRGLPHSVFSKIFGLDGWPLSSSIFFFVLPILAALPFADSFYSDTKSGYIKNVFIRAPKIHYLTAKALAVFLSAAAVILIPLIVNLLGAMMILPAVMPDPTTSTFPVASKCIWSGLFYTNPYAYCLLYFLSTSVFAGLFALIAPAISRFLRARFLVLAAPFVLYFFANTTLGLVGLHIFTPDNFIKPGHGHSLTTPLLLLIMLGLLIPCVVLFVVKGLKDETF